MLERARRIVFASIIGGAALLSVDAMPTFAGGCRSDDPECYPIIKTVTRQRFLIQAVGSSKSFSSDVYIESNTHYRFLGFSWPTLDGAKEAEALLKEYCGSGPKGDRSLYTVQDPNSSRLALYSTDCLDNIPPDQ